MATTYNTQIQQLYVAYFNRPADPKGLEYWEKVVEDAKGDLTAVSANFAASAEYKATYANMTNDQIVDAIYQNLFGHAADDAGKKFYSGNLTSGATTIDKVVAEVANGAQGSDSVVFSNKVQASKAFTAALDTDAEIAGYTTESAPLAKAFLAGITTGATLDVALTPANLNKSVGDVVAKGTVFTVTGALASLNAAQTAYNNFLASADGDNDATTSTTSAKLAAAVTAATTDVTGLLSADRATAYGATGATAAIKAALLGDQTTDYAAQIKAAQTTLAADQTAVNAITGLSAAISAAQAAQTNVDNATKAATAADAALAAQVASFQINNSTASHTVTLTIDPTTHAVTDGTGAGAVALIDASATGKLSLHTGVTETTNPGITALLNSLNADVNAHTAQTAAGNVLIAAQQNVSHLDVGPGDAATAGTEANALKAVKDLMTGQDTSPTEQQITNYATHLHAVADALPAGADKTAANNTATAFDNAVSDYRTKAAAAGNDPVSTKYIHDSDALADLVKASNDFNTAVSKLNAANTLVAQDAGFQASVAAAQQLFTNAHYNVIDIDKTGASLVAGGDSDLLIAGKTNATVSLFGLQGKDSISIGTGFVANTGKLSTGDDAAKEVFIHQADNGTDAVVQIEAHAFSSHVANATAPELVTITLTGVNAANLHFDAATGIISLA